MVFTQNQKNDISDIVKQAVKACLADENFMKDITTKVADMVIEKVEIRIKSLTDELNKMAEKNEQLEKENEYLRAGLDDIEQYTRRNSVRVFGVKEDKNENVDEKMIEVFNNKLGLSLNKNQIDRCHRVGRLNNHKPRAVIVKFLSYRDRALVFNSKKRLKGTGLQIKEDLTRIRLDILNNASEHFGYRNTWTNDGIIFINDKNNKVRIKSMGDLEKAIQKV